RRKAWDPPLWYESAELSAILSRQKAAPISARARATGLRPALLLSCLNLRQRFRRSPSHLFAVILARLGQRRDSVTRVRTDRPEKTHGIQPRPRFLVLQRRNHHRRRALVGLRRRD